MSKKINAHDDWFTSQIYKHAPRIKKGHKVPDHIGEYIMDLVLVMEPSGKIYDVLALACVNPKIWVSQYRKPPIWRIQE